MLVLELLLCSVTWTLEYHFYILKMLEMSKLLVVVKEPENHRMHLIDVVERRWF